MKNKYIIFSDGKSPHTLKWIKELKDYFELYLITLNGYREDVLEYICEENIYVINESVIGNGGNYALATKYFKIKKIINEVKPVYLNAHYLSSYGFIASLIKKGDKNLTLIHSTWGTDILVTPKKSFLHKKVAFFALSQADLVTSDSYFMSDEILKIYSESEIMTFPFGLDEIDTNTTIQKDKNLIFSNRAISANYNIDKIVVWFNQLKNKELKLVIANDGDKRDEILSLIKSLNLENRVIFVGFLNKEEQISYYKKANYYISIPSSDSTAVSLLEAMSFGCYPIVSNLPANREWIINNLNGSFFFDRLVLKDVADNVIINNQEIIEKNAIFSKSINSYVNKLNSL